MPRFLAAAFSSSEDFFVVPFLRKKETVMGIIGHTQGVTSATRPPKSPKRKICHRDVSDVSLSVPSSKAANWSMTGAQIRAEVPCFPPRVPSATGRLSNVSITDATDTFSGGAASLSSFMDTEEEGRVASPSTLKSTEVGGVQL